MPPTREYIIRHGTQIETDSCTMAILFNEVSKQKGGVRQETDFKRLRIMIEDKNSHKELFITAEKSVLSSDKKYSIDIAIVNEVVKEIVTLINAKKTR